MTKARQTWQIWQHILNTATKAILLLQFLTEFTVTKYFTKSYEKLDNLDPQSHGKNPSSLNIQAKDWMEASVKFPKETAQGLCLVRRSTKDHQPKFFTLWLY